MGVAALATFGFVHDSTTTILLTAAITLPSSVPAVVGYYVAYGLLALAPGASPSESSGSASCDAADRCTTTSTGDLATWFALTTDVLGVAALAAAALVNVLAWRLVRRR